MAIPKASVWRPKFLEELKKHGNISRAADVAGVTRQTVYTHKKNSAAFSDDWDEALEYAWDALELEARRRAEAGVRRVKFWKGNPIMVPLLDAEGLPVFDKDGEPVMVPYVEHEHSDNLTMFLLKGNRPEKYRDNQYVEHDGGITIRVEYDDADPQTAETP